MTRISFLITIVVLYHAWGCRAWAQESSSPQDNALLNSLAKTRESLRAKDFEILRTVVKRVKEQGRVSISDESSIEDTVGRLIEDKVLGLGAGGRQELVKKTIGEQDYSCSKEFS